MRAARRVAYQPEQMIGCDGDVPVGRPWTPDLPRLRIKAFRDMIVCEATLGGAPAFNEQYETEQEGMDEPIFD